MNYRGACILYMGMVLWGGSGAWGAPTSFELDLKELDSVRKSPGRPAAKTTGNPAGSQSVVKAPPPRVVSGEYRSYTVRPGENIFKILMRDYRLSNAEAERLIPEIARLNNLPDSRRLAVGQTLLLPRNLSSAEPSAPHFAKRRSDHEKSRASQDVPTSIPAPGGAMRQVAPAAPEPSLSSAPLVSAPVADAGKLLVQGPTILSAAPAPTVHPVGMVQAVAISGKESLGIFLRLADVLQIRLETNQVITSRGDATEKFSIKVPLYGEGLGKRVVVANSDEDSFQYTLFRLLASEGVVVLQFRPGDGFREVVSATLGKLGLAARFARYRLVNGSEQEVSGYLIDLRHGKVLLTDSPVYGDWTAFEVGGT